MRQLFADLALLQPLWQRGYTVLTPNRRLARAVLAAANAERTEAGSRAWATPSVMPFQQWLVEQWQTAVMSGALPPRRILEVPQQRRLWREIIEAEEGGFTLVSPASAALRCQQARRDLLLWQVDYRARATRQEFSFTADSEAFLRWLAAFDRRCAEGGFLTAEDAALELLEAPSLLADARVALLDCDSLPPLHAAVLEHAADRRELGAGSEDAALGEARAFADPRAELQAIARWCRVNVEQAPDRRIGVVLQDMGASRELLEVFLRREFDCLTTRYESLPVNFATGLTLDRVPLARDALRVLMMARSQVSVGDFTALLTSRFLSLSPGDAPDLGDALAELEGLGGDELPQRVLLAVLEPLECDGDAERWPWQRAATLSRRGRWNERARPPSAWIEPFRAQLEAWGWLQGAALDSLEYQQAEHWWQAVDGLVQYDGICTEVTLTQAVALLRDICAETLFQPRTDDAAIQVLGPQETTGLKFDALWLAGMSARHWPGPANPNPYLPRGLQRRLRMPQCDPQWMRERGAERWAHWRRSAQLLAASYVAVEDDAAVAPSPLLGGWTLTDGEAAQADPRWQRQAEAISRVVVEPERIPLQPAEPAAESVGSAALQEMAACPFQAFAAQRLGAHATAAGTPYLDASERGSLLHDALYQLFGDIADSATLRGMSETVRRDAIAQSVERALSRIPGTRRELMGGLALHLERDRLQALLWQWLELELSRDEAFEVVARELSHELQLGGLTLRLRTDREDLLAGGQRLTIDYKSGRPESASQWFSSPPRRPQLPLYALLQPTPDAIAYAIVRTGECGLNGVGDIAELRGVRPDIEKASGEAGVSDMADARVFWAGELGQLAADFVAGDVAVEPRHGQACTYCQRFSLCRLDEVQS